jgi:cytochrome b561
MRLRSTRDAFGAVAKTFHWLTFLLLVGSFMIALRMESLPLSPRKLQLFAWHKWVGVTVLAVVVLRLAWRLANPVPRQPSGVPRWQQRLAGLSHAALYGLLIVIPVTGWVMSEALNLPVVYLGLFRIPSPFGVDRALGEAMRALHLVLALTMLALIGIHALAALYHHFVLRDDVLRRMLPWPRARCGRTESQTAFGGKAGE